MVLITIVTGAYKPTYNWGALHCNDDSIGKPKKLSQIRSRVERLPGGFSFSQRFFRKISLLAGWICQKLSWPSIGGFHSHGIVMGVALSMDSL